MGQATEISWTDHTFNPWWGCVEVSPACDHCYAKTFARRVGFSDTGSKFPIWGKGTARRDWDRGSKHWLEPFAWDAAAAKAGVRRRVFCGSMCDVMEENGELGYLLQARREWLYEVIANTPHLDWLLLTKRPQNFRRFLPQSWLDNPRPNVWGMTTVESVDYLWRATELVNTPFAVRGLSVEPLLGPLSLRWAPWEELKGHPHTYGHLDGLRRLSWVIVGGESGPGARPMHPGWARQLRDECIAAGVPFHFKQWGSWMPLGTTDGRQELPFGEYLIEGGKPTFGFLKAKKDADRRIDGREWNELPASPSKERP